MFDSFDPFCNVPKQNFAFQPSRYETWIEGKMVSSGRTNSLVAANLIFQNESEKVEISYFDANLNHELASKNTFDEFITGNDRLQLITIPANTNVESVAIMMFLSTIGSTRSHKNFNRNEPYCCNLFLQNGIIVKITFSFCNPEKLLEFYSS